MISRRAVVGSAAVVAGASVGLGAGYLTHTLDDAARWAGLKPKPKPEPRDVELVSTVAGQLSLVAMSMRLVHEQRDDDRLEGLALLCDEQMAALGGSNANLDLARSPNEGEMVDLLARTADLCRDSAMQARSGELIVLLTSVAAGLAQCEQKVAAL